MANDWSEIFDNYGIKRVSATDRSQSAYLPGKEQQAALAAAGHEPGNAEDKDFIEIELLGEDHVPLVTSYYNSRRLGSGRDPEVRMGRGIVSWSTENDELVIGLSRGNLSTRWASCWALNKAADGILLNATSARR